ncbi:MAG: hypothetical protein O7F08_06370 [Deltaproteobacteria bacterium]|nr:hypothetical protein [Deltaproteobacteria bacterium]
MVRAETFTIEQPPKKSGGSSKLWLGILIGCGGVLVLCCGGAGILGFMGARFARDLVVKEPAEIRAATTEIAQIDIPPEYEPQLLLRLSIPFMGDLGNMVIYATEDETGAIMLAEFGEEMTQGKSPEQVTREWQIQFQAQANNPQLDPNAVDAETTETLERNIRGEPTKFTIVQGKNRETEEEQIVASGSFKGHKGVGYFIMSADPDKLTIDDVKAVINSLQ